MGKRKCVRGRKKGVREEEGKRERGKIVRKRMCIEGRQGRKEEKKRQELLSHSDFMATWR